MLEDEAHSMPQDDPANAGHIEKKAILAASIGTALEWYDVFLFLSFSIQISKLFFPAANSWVSLLATVGTFAVSYIMKPVGALVLSSYADRVSRKSALTVTLSLMAIGIGMTAFAPSYASIGLSATMIMILARCVQGFSSGGEYGASTAFLVERSPAARRGFYASFNIAALGFSSVLAGIAGMLVGGLLTPDQVLDWGWRLPFIFGLSVVPVALYIRRVVPEHASERSMPRSPIKEAVVGHRRYLLLGIGAFALVTVANYCLAFYMPTYAVRNLGLPPVSAFAGTLLIGAIQTVLAPLFGALSDRHGRTPIMLFASLGLAVMAVPCFLVLVAHPTVLMLLLSQAILGTMLTAYQAPMPALLCDLFPASLRATGVAIVHDFTATLVGGFTPFAITFAIGMTGNNLIPGIYVAIAATLSLGCIWTIRSMSDAARSSPILVPSAPGTCPAALDRPPSSLVWRKSRLTLTVRRAARDSCD
jgi:MHS family proline/betaine transporter-like MFS transporter